MNVFTQGIVWKTFNLVGNTRVILTNRINHVNVQATANLKKDTREKLKTVPEKPKRPLNAYMRFVKDNRDTFAKNNPKLPPSQLLKKVAEGWKEVDAARKEKYEEDFKKENAVYYEKLAKYTNELSVEQKGILNMVNEEKKKAKERRALKKLYQETGRPKQPVPPFFRYLAEQHKTTNKGVVELSLEVKDKWAAMPEEQKQKYILQYQGEREQYEHDLKKWEVQMIKKGNLDVVREKTLKDAVPTKTFHEIKHKRSQ